MLFSGDKTNTINALFAHLVGTKKNERMLYQYICSQTLSKRNKKHAVLYLLTLWGQERQTNMLYKKKRQICTINSHTVVVTKRERKNALFTHIVGTKEEEENAVFTHIVEHKF